MPWRLWVGLALVAGCTAPTGQPIEVVESAPRRELQAVSPEALDPLLELNLGAVVQSASIEPNESVGRRFVTLEPADLMTSTGRTASMLTFGPDSHELYELVLREPHRVRVVRYEGPPWSDAGGEEVDVTLRPGSSGHGDTTRRIEIVAEHGVLAWYGIKVDLPAPVLGSVRDGERSQLARFRPDSHPILTHLLMGNRDGESIVEVRFSERVAGDVPATEWTLSDERGQLQCSVLGPQRGREEHHAVFNCDRLPEGRARIDFGGTMQTVVGTELVDGNERALASVEFEAPRVEQESVQRVPVFVM